jgi:hypothetical protein
MEAVPLTASEVGGASPVVNTTIMVGSVMVTLALTDLVVSAAAVAVMVTLPPVGTEGGAWYVTGAMLAVFAGAMVPHAGGALGQVTDQFTPAFVVSFVTVASIVFTVALTSIVAGGACPEVKAMEIAVEGVMVTTALTDFVLSAVDVAAIVTVPPVGTVGGAV